MIRFLYFIICVWLPLPLVAQELDPRRWAHLPINTNFFGAGHAYTQADISFNPTLVIEDAELTMHTSAAAFIRTFRLFDKTGRMEITQAWKDARWSGKLDGMATSVSRHGLADTRFRLALNLIGAPALAGKDYAAYRAATDVETIVGVALGVQLPTGNYRKDKLLNIGSNRFNFRPQIGVVHSREKWTFEATGTSEIYTDNQSFFNGNTLEQDPFYTFQTHAIHTFSPGLWASASLGYGVGGQSAVNGVSKNDQRSSSRGP